MDFPGKGKPHSDYSLVTKDVFRKNVPRLKKCQWADRYQCIKKTTLLPRFEDKKKAKCKT